MGGNAGGTIYSGGMPVNKDDPGNMYGGQTPPPPSPTGSPVSAPTVPYTPNGPYTTPTFAYTPQAGYSGLAQQLAQAMNPSLQAYAAPRTGLADMFASPWSVLYGGPAQPTFADFYGQDPNMGRPPATTPPTTPPPIVPPPTTPPRPPGTPAPTTPGNSVPGVPYPGTSTPKSGGSGPSPIDPTGLERANAWLAQQHAFDANLPTTGPEGRDLGSVLFPQGRPAGGHTRAAPKGLLSGVGNFEQRLPTTGPGGRDLGSVLFPNGRPARRNR